MSRLEAAAECLRAADDVAAAAESLALDSARSDGAVRRESVQALARLGIDFGSAEQAVIDATLDEFLRAPRARLERAAAKRRAAAEAAEAAAKEAETAAAGAAHLELEKGASSRARSTRSPRTSTPARERARVLSQLRARAARARSAAGRRSTTCRASRASRTTPCSPRWRPTPSSRRSSAGAGSALERRRARGRRRA